MSDQEMMGFGKFVPGFDFLQNLAKGASGALPQMPNMSSWVAPTLNVEDLEKRIGELKAVHFWLDQNSKALGATIQALEVQKMTLATLKGMNFNMGEVANALKLKATDTMFGAQPAAEPAASGSGEFADMEARGPGVTPRKSPAPKKTPAKKTAASASVVDPMAWWGSLTQQFQEIASSAMKDAATQTAVDTARNMATGVAKGMAKGALKTASGMAKAASNSARKTSARTRAKK